MIAQCSHSTLQSLHNAITPHLYPAAATGEQHHRLARLNPPPLHAPPAGGGERPTNHLARLAPPHRLRSPPDPHALSFRPSFLLPPGKPALACTRLRVPPSLLCNPHHGMIALCNHCKLLSPCTPTLPLPLRYRSHLIPPRLHHLPAGCPSFPSYPPVNQPPPTARESPSCPTSCAPPSPCVRRLHLYPPPCIRSRPCPLRSPRLHPPRRSLTCTPAALPASAPLPDLTPPSPCPLHQQHTPPAPRGKKHLTRLNVLPCIRRLAEPLPFTPG